MPVREGMRSRRDEPVGVRDDCLEHGKSRGIMQKRTSIRTLPMPRGVSNFLIHLSAIGRLHLFQQFSSALFLARGRGRGGSHGRKEVRKAREAGWISVVEPGNIPMVPLEQDLHPDEAESIALALEIRPDTLLLDETEARSIAGLYNIPITGITEGRVASMREERQIQDYEPLPDRSKERRVIRDLCTLWHIYTIINIVHINTPVCPPAQVRPAAVRSSAFL